VGIYEFTLPNKRWLSKEDFYDLIEENQLSLCLRGEGIAIAYEVFLEWIKQKKISFEELLIMKKEEMQCYLTQTGIYGLIYLAEYWLCKSPGYSKKHKTLLRAQYRVYNQSRQIVRAFSPLKK
jgi:hypothetical protein